MKRKNVLIMFAAVVLFAMVGSNCVLAQKSDYVHYDEWDNENLVSKTISILLLCRIRRKNSYTIRMIVFNPGMFITGVV